MRRKIRRKKGWWPCQSYRCTRGSGANHEPQVRRKVSTVRRQRPRRGIGGVPQQHLGRTVPQKPIQTCGKVMRDRGVDRSVESYSVGGVVSSGKRRVVPAIFITTDIKTNSICVSSTMHALKTLHALRTYRRAGESTMQHAEAPTFGLPAGRHEDVRAGPRDGGSWGDRSLVPREGALGRGREAHVPPRRGIATNSRARSPRAACCALSTCVTSRARAAGCPRRTESSPPGVSGASPRRFAACFGGRASGTETAGSPETNTAFAPARFWSSTARRERTRITRSSAVRNNSRRRRAAWRRRRAAAGERPCPSGGER